jgi:Uma2 family endonuclease
MTTLLGPPKVTETLADLLEQLGGISPARVRIRPAPGLATEQDILALHDHDGRLFELVDGVLVEKAMGFQESCLAGVLYAQLWLFVHSRNLGLVTVPDGMVRLATNLIRIPDVSFTSWDRIPGRRMPTQPVPHLCPDLAVEVLSESNTDAEMDRKRREYFGAGVRLAWFVDPRERTVDVYTAVDQFTTLTENQTLDGGKVLPGFALPLRNLFAELDRQGPPVTPS